MKTAFTFRFVVAAVSFLLLAAVRGQNILSAECVPRLGGCVTDGDCCGGNDILGCFERPVPGNPTQLYKACDLRACCTKDEWTCMADDDCIGSECCNSSPTSCMSDTCGGSSWFEREPGMSTAVEGCATEDCSLATGATPCNRTNGMIGILLCHNNIDFCTAPQAWSRRCERLGNTCGSCSANNNNNEPTNVPTARPSSTPSIRAPSSAPSTDGCSPDYCSLDNDDGATACTRSNGLEGVLLCHNGGDFCSPPQAWPRRCRDYGNTCGSCSASETTFCVIADVPYTTNEALGLQTQIAQELEGCSFVIHLGDIKAGRVPCTRDRYSTVRDILLSSNIPVFIVPGDNEWNDCGNATEIEHGWDLWTEMFLRLEESWDHPFSVTRPDDRPENFYFVHRRTLFVGLNIVGGTVHDQDEWNTRLSEQYEWVRGLVERYIPTDAAGLVIFAHARPNRRHNPFFEPLRDFLNETLENEYPVAYLHGDGHKWEYNLNFFELPNYLGIQTEGGVRDPPLKIIANPFVHSEVTQAFAYDRQLA